MKSLIAGIVLIVVVGFAGFLYRNVAEQGGGPEPVACTMDAKLCPDGSSVGRTGPSCEFAPCPALLLGTTPELHAVIPDGYTENKEPNVNMGEGGDMTIMREFRKPSLSGSVMHTLTLHDLGVDPGDTTIEDIEDNIVRDTVFSPSDMPAESIADFDKVIIAGRVFYSAVIERFEGVVHSRYYLPIELPSGNANLYSFDLVEHDVSGWMEPDLVIEDLPEHKAFLEMLSALTEGE